MARREKQPLPCPPAAPQLPPVDFYTRLNAWLTARRRWVLLGLLAVAVLVRLVFFFQARATPLVQMDKWDQTDMYYYVWWANQIRSGDLLSRNVPGPYNAWHDTIANRWLELNPALHQELTRLAATRQTDPQHQLWRQWLGEKTFYQEPAYPYLLALTYSIFGENPLWVFAWQMLLGVGAVVLAFRIAERHFDVVAAVAAGLLTALAAVELMHEMILLRDALLTFLTLLLIDLSDRALATGTGWRWLLLGAVFGFALLVKSVFLPFLPCLGGLLIWQNWRAWRPMLISTAFLTAGLLLALSPAIVRNVMVGIPPLKFTGTNAGMTFIANNLPDFAWDAPNPLSEKYMPRLMGESDSSFLRAVLLTLNTHPDWWSFARIPLWKFDQVWHWWERPDNVSFYHYQLFAPLLAWLPAFFLIAPLGLVGLTLTFGRFRFHLTLYLMLAVSILPMVVAAIMMRYRLPTVAITILFAGFCLAWLLQQAARGRWIWLGGVAGAVLLVGLWTGRSLPDSVPLIRRCDCTGTFMGIYRESAGQAAQARDYSRAAGILEDFLHYEPPVVRSVAGMMPKNPEEALTVDFYALVHNDCANLYRAAGMSTQAEAHARRAAELKQVFMDFVKNRP